MCFSYACEFGEDACKTVNPTSPSQRIGRHAAGGSDEPGAAIERANPAPGNLGRVPGLGTDGDPGPSCSHPHWRDVCATTEHTIGEGARLLAGGSAPNRPDDSCGIRPTLLDDMQNNSVAGQEEIRGPVPSVLEHDAFDQGMEMLNGTEFMLTSALFSDRNALFQHLRAESRNGMIHVNRRTVPDNNMPFGGIRNSGVGTNSVGPTAVNFHTSEHSACLAC